MFSTTRKGTRIMNPVDPIKKGLRPLRAIYDKVNEIAAFLTSLRPVAGGGIELTETPNGTIFRADVSAASWPSRQSAEWVYDGPFALSMNPGPANQRILCRPGLLCRNGDCRMTNTLSMGMPSADAYIALYSELRANGEWSEPALCAVTLSEAETFPSWSGYFILGAFSNTTKKVVQYHCSPVVHLIVAGDLLV